VRGDKAEDRKTRRLADLAGTEAAAATAVMMRSSIRRVPYFTMRINRPFLFLIRDRVTGTILFMGRVTDPRSG